MSHHSSHGHCYRSATAESLPCCYMGITVHLLQVVLNPSGMSVAVISKHFSPQYWLLLVAYVIQIIVTAPGSLEV